MIPPTYGTPSDFSATNLNMEGSYIPITVLRGGGKNKKRKSKRKLKSRKKLIRKYKLSKKRKIQKNTKKKKQTSGGFFKKSKS
tara:strand:+ start:94 stop:342 length:249 start_codon:yes stop_codon:yes gene_type:complete